jgi:nitrogen-specific signal transduction histidine kinase/ActR/RegA family two-component response regulator
MPGSISGDRQVERAARQLRLEDAALVTRRLAHDFGNALTGILGFSELSLAQLSQSDPCYRQIAEIHRAAQQGAEFTQGLHWFSRRGTMRPASSVLADAAVLETARLGSMAGGAKVRLDLSEDLPPLAIDTDELRQILRRALDNAREALDGTGTGTVSLSARLTELTEADCRELLGNCSPGAYVEVAILDTGHGLDAEARRRVLAEPFFSTKPNHRGMGLAVIYGILHCHRGGLRFDAGADQGAALRLYVPVAARPSPVAPPAVENRPGRGERVLVVDDDPIVLQLVCSTLEHAGYQPCAASSGAEAERLFTAASANPFRLVMTDVLMPRMSGVELARRLLGHDAGVNVLFMSGQPSGDFDQMIPGHWPFEVMPKPFRTEGLLRAIRVAIDQGNVGMSASPRGLGQEGLIPSSR